MPPTKPTPTEAIDGPSLAPFRAYHAPQGHGDTFFDPQLDQATTLIQQNARTLSTHGDDLSTLRSEARSQLVDDALRYTSAYRDVDWAKRIVDNQGSSVPRIVMAGHQPTLFHPGVWFKNFALSRIGQQTGALAINLVIDNDVAAGGAIRVPRASDGDLGSDESAEVVYTSVPYDRAGGGVPFEQTTVDDRVVFDGFDQAVRKEIAPLVADPCVTALWQHARAAIDRCGVAGCALAQARHGLESDVGLQTLELPMSVVARGKPFARFALSILSDLSRFHDCYNSSAQTYRRAHGIRSTAHPVPDLHSEQDKGDVWFEAPLWVYGNDSPARKPVWAKLDDQTLTVADRIGWSVTIDLRDRDQAVEQLAAAAGPNCKLRPRALLTTMYARCVLSDLFLHGIGGGKYDQLGDMITEAFFRIQPTEFMVVSATIRLPDIQVRDVDAEIRSVRRRLRETIYQPERFADDVSLDSASLARKHELLSAIPDRGDRADWHREVTLINESLSRSLEGIQSQLRRKLAELRSSKESQSRLSSREHSFCLFPLDYLVETFDTLLAKSVNGDE